MTYLIDIGANLTDEVFDIDISEVIDRASKLNTSMILTGTCLRTSQLALKLSDQFQLYSTAGIHPHQSQDLTVLDIPHLKSILMNPRVVAAGEMGLDFFRNFSPPTIQEKVYRQQLELAVEHKKPIFLHDRETKLRTLSIVKEYRDQLGKIVIHCFTGNQVDLKQWLDMGCFVGVTGWVTDKQRGVDLRDAIPYIPIDRLLIETDAPYLLPKNLPSDIKKSLSRRGRNEPALLSYVLEAIVELRPESYQVLANAIYENTLSFFKLSDKRVEGHFR